MEDKILQAIEALNQKIDKSINGLNLKIDKSIEGLDRKIDISIESLDQKIDKSTQSLNQKFDTLSSQVHENTQILKALEHLAQINKAEHDKMTLDIAEISGEVKSIRKNLSKVELVTADNWSDIVKLKALK